MEIVIKPQAACSPWALKAKGAVVLTAHKA
jgi:hypothetical protein